MEDNNIKAFLADHPRMMGVLFTLALLFTQIGSAAGSQIGGTVVGS